MADLKIDDRLWDDPRFFQLVSKTRSRELAVGALVFAWKAAKKFRAKLKLIPMEEWQQLAHCDEIVEVGLAVIREGGVYVKGADALFSKKKSEKTAANPVNLQTWESYAEEYKNRYGVAPVRNVQSNALIKSFVQKLGAESPDVARFYIKHHDQFYGRSAHSLAIMVRDAEKLRTEWATGNKISDRRKTNAETNADLAGELWRKNQRNEL